MTPCGIVVGSPTSSSTTDLVSSSESVVSLVSRCVRALGTTRVFAAPGHGLGSLEGLAFVDVASERVAIALADADGRLSVAPHARPGVALLPGRRLRISSLPGADVQPVSVAVEDLPAAIAGWSLGRVFGAIEIELPSDLGAMAPDGLQPLVVQRSDQLLRLSPSLADFATMVLVGPGVVRDGATHDVVGFVERSGAGVMCTTGAVGIVPFDHPAWCGVVGLQADDPALGGLDACELVIAVGIDDTELGASLPPDAQVLEVEPWHLPFLAADWVVSPTPRRVSSLVEACAAVYADHRDDSSQPLHPVRAVLDLLDATDHDVTLLVDGGPVGLWFARGVVPVPAGRSIVSGSGGDGFAVAAATIAAMDGNRAIAVTTPGGPLDDELLDLAAGLGLAVTVERWGDDVVAGDPARHRADIVAAMADPGVQVTSVAVDLSAGAELVELMGPVVAWT